MNAALKLVTAALAAQQPAKRTPSTRQQEITANLSLISRTWRTLSEQQRQSWIAFGQTWSPIPGKSTAPGLTVFQALNGVRLNTHQGDILPNAPVQPDFLGKLPRFQVSAALPALALSDKSAPTPRLALSIRSSPFPGPVQVLATRPLSAGVSRPSPRDFRRIAVLPNLTAPDTDLSAAYLAQFPAPAIGMKVAIQMVPVTPNGFKGSPFTQIITVTAAPVPAFNSEDTAPPAKANAGGKQPPAENKAHPHGHQNQPQPPSYTREGAASPLPGNLHPQPNTSHSQPNTSHSQPQAPHFTPAKPPPPSLPRITSRGTRLSQVQSPHGCPTSSPRTLRPARLPPRPAGRHHRPGANRTRPGRLPHRRGQIPVLPTARPGV